MIILKRAILSYLALSGGFDVLRSTHKGPLIYGQASASVLGDFCQMTDQPACLFVRLLGRDNSYIAQRCACCRSLKTNE